MNHQSRFIPPILGNLSSVGFSCFDLSMCLRLVNLSMLFLGSGLYRNVESVDPSVLAGLRSLPAIRSQQKFGKSATCPEQRDVR